MKHQIYTDPEQCRQIWESAWPVNGIFDLWQVRQSFHEFYMKPLQFHVVEHDGRITGFLPLCWNEETGQFVLFPGETWKGKTWLEQNRILAEDSQTFHLMLDAVPGSLHLRYLSWNPVLELAGQCRVDEIGYLFYPGIYDFSFENYWLGFSGKSRKKIRGELKKLESRDLTFRFNVIEDLDLMFDMNQHSFAGDSYFNDPKFYQAFNRMAAYLREMGMLRIVTVLVGGKAAAVDMGGIFNNTYTLFAGGTNFEFPGIAKIINLHHMEWACQKRFDVVDFLCGDFNWKERFHLSPRPLYEISVRKMSLQQDWSSLETEALCA